MQPFAVKHYRGQRAEVGGGVLLYWRHNEIQSEISRVFEKPKYSTHPQDCRAGDGYPSCSYSASSFVHDDLEENSRHTMFTK